MKKRILALGLVLFLVSSAYAVAEVDDYFESTVFYRGDVLFELAKETYAAGEELTTEFTAANLEDFPIIDAYLVVDVVSGGSEHEYPTQVSDVDNIIYEEKIAGINLPANGKKTVAFSYRLPEDLKAGTYRLEAYLKTERTPIVGIPTIMLSPQHRSFRVEGAGSFPQARILRKTTVFEKTAGQVGPPVKAESNVVGSVYLGNEGTAAVDSVLSVSVCAWDDTSCAGDALIWSKEYAVSLKPKATQAVTVEFTAPKKADAYAIRMGLSDKDGRTMSIYRNRIIVSGETAKIMKLAVDKFFYKKDAAGKIIVLAGASPDPSINWSTKNAKVYVSIDDATGNIFSGSETIPELSVLTTGLVAKSFGFTATKELSEFTVCAKIESEKGELFDRYCYTVKPDKSMVTENMITTKWSYDYAKSSLDVELCSEDVSGVATEASAAAMLMDAGNALVGAKEGLALKPCQKTSFAAKAGEYRLVVNDLGTNQQTTTKISIEKRVACGDGSCDAGESSADCCSDCGCAAGMECAAGRCVAEEKKPGIQDNTALYLVVALVLVAVAALLLSRRKKKT